MSPPPPGAIAHTHCPESLIKMSVVCATNPTQQQTPTVISPTVCLSISFSILFVCFTLMQFSPYLFLSLISHTIIGIGYCINNCKPITLQDTKQTVVSKALYTAISYRYLLSFHSILKQSFQGKETRGTFTRCSLKQVSGRG